MKTVILMVSETPDLILGTIQSRAQRIHIRPIETDAIMNAMVSRFGLSPDDAKHVAHLSSGSFIKAMEAISLGEENKFFLEQFKAMMRNERNVIDLMEELAKAERHITQNVNAKMVFFDLSLRITVLIKR